MNPQNTVIILKWHQQISISLFLLQNTNKDILLNSQNVLPNVFFRVFSIPSTMSTASMVVGGDCSNSWDVSHLLVLLMSSINPSVLDKQRQVFICPETVSPGVITLDHGHVSIICGYSV